MLCQNVPPQNDDMDVSPPSGPRSPSPTPEHTQQRSETVPKPPSPKPALCRKQYLVQLRTPLPNDRGHGRPWGSKNQPKNKFRVERRAHTKVKWCREESLQDTQVAVEVRGDDRCPQETRIRTNEENDERGKPLVAVVALTRRAKVPLSTGQGREVGRKRAERLEWGD